MGIVCPAQGMAASPDPILAFQELRLFLRCFILDKKRIGGKPPIGIRAAPSKESVNLILGNKCWMLLPCKPLPCLIGNCFLCKFLELSRHSVRAVERKTYQILIRFICFRQSRQTLVQIRQILRLV